MKTFVFFKIFPFLMGPAVLLTLSFFVLVVLKKLEEGGLKKFGYVVAAILWLLTGLIIWGGLNLMCGYDFKKAIHKKDSMKGSASCPMMKDAMGEKCGEKSMPLEK